MGDNTGACITLLRHRAEIGTKDQGGWTELHHVHVHACAAFKSLCKIFYFFLSSFVRRASMGILSMLVFLFAMELALMHRIWWGILLYMWLFLMDK